MVAKAGRLNPPGHVPDARGKIAKGQAIPYTANFTKIVGHCPLERMLRENQES
jgi:hypothetical protein